MLHAKYECFSPYGLSPEDFKIFPSLHDSMLNGVRPGRAHI